MIGRTPVGVDQHDLAGVHAIHGHQLPDEYLVRAVRVEYFEPQGQRVADLGGRLHVRALPVRDLHGHVRRVHDHLFRHGRFQIALHAQVHLVRHRLVGQVVLARDRHAQVGTSDDGVVVLDDHVVHVPAQALLFHVALHVVVRHLQLELQTAAHVLHARIRIALRVDLAVEQLAGLDLGHHVSRTALDADVVTRVQLVGRRFRHFQVRVLKHAV